MSALLPVACLLLAAAVVTLLIGLIGWPSTWGFCAASSLLALAVVMLASLSPP